MTRRIGIVAAAVVLWAASAAAQSPVTFATDVAPIIYAKCGICHRPGGEAPFSLLTYGSARGHATQMAMLTRSGAMPRSRITTKRSKRSRL